MDLVSREALLALADQYAAQLHASLSDRPELKYDTLAAFNVGFIRAPRKGHERFRHGVTVPYPLHSPTGGSTAMIKVRMPSGQQKKYDVLAIDRGLADAQHRILPFYAQPILNEQFVVLCEGEFDAMVVTQLGVAAVGIPGANAWKPTWAHMYYGKVVKIAFDPDDAGYQGAKQIESSLRHAGARPEVVRLPEGVDISSHARRHGIESLGELLGL